MDYYSSEDYSDHDDDYCFVPTATSPPEIRAQVENETQNNELQHLIIDQQNDVSESVYFDVLPKLEAETAEEEGGGMEQSIYLAVESYFDLEGMQAGTGFVAALEAETVVEELDNSEAEAEADLVVALEAETAVIIDVIEESSETVAANVVVLEAETVVEYGGVIEEFIYEAVESDSHLEAEAEDMVEEDDVVEEEVDMVEEEDDMDEDEDDMVEEDEDFVEEEHDMVEEGDAIDEFIYELLESDNNIRAAQEDVVEQAEALVEEGAGMKESIYEALESNSDLQAEELEALAKPADAIEFEMTSSKVQESDSHLEPEEPEHLIDEQSDSDTEESDLSEEESDSDIEESDLSEEESDSDTDESDLSEEESDSDTEESDRSEEEWDSYEDKPDLSEEEWDSDAEECVDPKESDVDPEDKDDVVVTYLNSSPTIRNNSWTSNLVPASALAWAKLPVTDTTTLEEISLLESFLGCSPMLMLQECGNAVMNIIETVLCELERIRNRLRRVLGSLFPKRETTNHDC